VIASGIRDGKPFKATHRFITSPRTTPRSIATCGERALEHRELALDSWHPTAEDHHHYRGNGAGAMPALRTAGLNLLRLAGYDSIREGLQAVMHEITTLLAMAKRQPELNP
jgi:hypothetical protein